MLPEMERIVLVHGSVSNGWSTWRALRPLGHRYELVVLNRPGFPPGPLIADVDFERDAAWVAARVREGDHLVGHSYGGVIALLTAARQPGLRSLTVVEPPAFSVARGERAVEDFVAYATALWLEGPRELEPFLRGFLQAVGSPYEPPSPLPRALEHGARLLMVERPPWEAQIPLAALRAARYPKLVVSGGHSAAFDAVCDVLGRELDAERAVCRGAGHTAQSAPGFNELLSDFVDRGGAT